MSRTVNLAPFKITEPTVISFSGGRTSGYMLRLFLDANGGGLPANCAVIFANTGKEREETLEFVRDVAANWDVPVVWLEFSDAAEFEFRRVTFDTASRNGEPFTQVIRRKQVLPNPLQRFCTQWLKIKISNRYVRRVLKWRPYANAIGLRADEPRRVAKLKADPKSSPGEEPFAPLSRAGVTEEDVLRFWASQPFDLRLKSHEGNCDLCFLKSQHAIERITRERPDLAEWWIGAEAEMQGKTRTSMGAFFRKDRPSYAATLRRTIELPMLFDDLPEERQDCRCTD